MDFLDVVDKDYNMSALAEIGIVPTADYLEKKQKDEDLDELGYYKFLLRDPSLCM
jgi:hypothetical protein